MFWSKKEVPKEKVEEDKGPGLRKIFRVGEHLPWKGIWFEIEEVVYDRIVLKPTFTTGGFKKHGR